jgi:hypothetical protein
MCPLLSPTGVKAKEAGKIPRRVETFSGCLVGCLMSILTNWLHSGWHVTFSSEGFLASPNSRSPALGTHLINPQWCS